MTTMGLFFAGLLAGIVGTAFFVLIMSIRSEFTEIIWHNAKLEDPSEYNTSEGIEVLVHLSSGEIEVINYFPAIKAYSYNSYIRPEMITHFAYAVEVANTIPKRTEPTLKDCNNAVQD